MFSHLKRFLRDESGPTAVEYGVMLALIVVVCIGSVQLMAQNTANSFDDSAAELAGVMGS
jgi:pilus assembly protein Flp/PilA